MARFADTLIAVDLHIRLIKEGSSQFIRNLARERLLKLRQDIVTHIRELNEHNALMAAHGRPGIE